MISAHITKVRNDKKKGRFRFCSEGSTHVFLELTARAELFLISWICRMENLVESKQDNLELVKHNRLMQLVRPEAKIEEQREFLAHPGVDVNTSYARTGQTPLMYPGCLSTERVKLLLGAGADVNAVSTDGCTALIDAVICGAKGSVEILIAAGADVNMKDNNGFTALWYAIQCSFTDCIDILMEEGADVTLASNNTPEILLSALGNHRIVRLLIEAGVDVNEEPETCLTNQEPRNPLICAVRDCALPADFRARWQKSYISKIKCVQLLLGAGADVKKHSTRTCDTMP